MRPSRKRYRSSAVPTSSLPAAVLSAALLALAAGCGSGSGASSSAGGGNPGNGNPGGGDPGGGSGDPGGSDDPYGPGGGNGDPAIEPSFASIQEAVFTPICTACHVGATAPHGLRLDEANSYGLLVGIPSAQVPTLQRVAPGDPDNSYLIQKLEGTAAVGERMPAGGAPLPQPTIDVIRQWILDGALPEPSEPPAAPIRVTSLTPMPGETLAEMPPVVVAQFDRELDATSVTAETFTLERSGADGTFGDGNEVAIAAAAVGVSPSNPMAAMLDLAGTAPVEDTYRVRLAGAGATQILDLDANALDGEFGGTFPSGDGTQGGDFIADFVVAGIQPTLDSIQTHVLTPICSACHTGPASAVLPSGMDLTSADASFASLVGVPSVQDPTVARVEPGNADASYLVQKIEGTAAQGARMPLGQAPLDAATIAAIRAWVAAGAAR